MVTVSGERAAYRNRLGRGHGRQAGHARSDRQDGSHARHADQSQPSAASLLDRGGAQDLARVMRPTAWDEGQRSHLYVVRPNGEGLRDLIEGARYDVPPPPFGGSEA